MKQLAMLVVVFLGWSAFFPVSTVRAEDLRIGSILPYTGSMASLGERMTRSMELYFDEIQWKAAGRDIKLFKEDDENSPKIGLEKAKKLVESQRVHLLMGPVNSAVAYALAPYAVSKRIPWIINNAGSVELTQKMANKYIFRTSFANGQYEYPLAPFAYQKLGYRKMVIMASDFAAGYEKAKGFKKEFIKAGGEIVQEIYTPLGTADYAAYLGQVKNADAVWTFYTGSDAIKFVKQFDQYGLKKKMGLTGVGSLTNEVYLDAEGDAALDAVTSTFYSPLFKNPLNEKFVKGYVGKFKEMPSYDDYAGYISVQVVVKALERIKGDIENTEGFLQSLKATELEGPAGKFRFDERQNVILTVFIQKVVREKGKLINSIVEIVPNVKQISLD